jgi:hypothetical protein
MISSDANSAMTPLHVPYTCYLQLLSLLGKTTFLSARACRSDLFCFEMPKQMRIYNKP